MNATESAETTLAPHPAAATRAALVCGILGIILVAVIIAAQLVRAFNPYQDATDQVNFLLQTQPDLEVRLDYIEMARTRLQAYLDMEAAYAVADIGSTAEEQLVEVLAAQGIRSTDVRTFTGLIEDAAAELTALQAELQQPELAAPLKPLFYQIRQQPQISDSERLNQIQELSPKVVEDLNDLRRRLQSISTYLRQITESPHLEQIPAMLSADAATALPGDSDAWVYLNAYTAWKGLPKASESLEIQFAGTVSILEDVFTAVNTARLQDRRWGYSTWEPAAAWINTRLGITIAAAVVLLLIAVLLLLRSRIDWIRVNQGPDQRIRAFMANLALSLRQARPTASLPGADFIQGGETAPPSPAQPTRRRTLNKEGDGINPRLLVLWPNGERENYPLSTDMAFRIGTDPRNPVYIDKRDAGYIEIWIRGARTGFFLEVMFCESPVLLNRLPVSGARALHDGDLIQVLDVSLIYSET
ncbi:MAG: FHA domain-containing protein [Bellilinea sp.]